MKRIPAMENLEAVLRSSRIVRGGFLGADPRILEDILAADAADLERCGYAPGEVSARMRELTLRAKAGLGAPVMLDEKREGIANDTRGVIPCPWPHEARFGKTMTTIRRVDSDETLRWSDLSIHLIGAHGFFGGRGSPFRLEPAALVRVIFE